ncbi:unnamed protein product [Absidia cylindrospora]
MDAIIERRSSSNIFVNANAMSIGCPLKNHFGRCGHVSDSNKYMQRLKADDMTLLLCYGVEAMGTSQASWKKIQKLVQSSQDCNNNNTISIQNLPNNRLSPPDSRFNNRRWYPAMEQTIIISTHADHRTTKHELLSHGKSALM